jgi:tryptophanyl-tRNA synthetase
MEHDGGRLVSGVKPTGRPHIGNYLGAMKQFVALQERYQSYVFVADMHALTTVQDGAELARNARDVALDYLAIGINPEKTAIYLQSDVPEVAELAWVFQCLTTMPYLMRAHAYKDAEAKNKEINAGVFAYPLLMAADILIQNADAVPVGNDQRQHIEIARDIAEKFNRIYGETFVVPSGVISEDTQSVPGTDGQKMSKSYRNTVPLFSDKSEITKLVMSIPTDSRGVDEPKDPDTCKVFQLHTFVTGETVLEDLRERYLAGGISYKESKDLLVDSLESLIGPLRTRREELAADSIYLDTVLKTGAEKARENASRTMNEVRKAVGFGSSRN